MNTLIHKYIPVFQRMKAVNRYKHPTGADFTREDVIIPRYERGSFHEEFYGLGDRSHKPSMYKILRIRRKRTGQLELFVPVKKYRKKMKQEYYKKVYC